MKFGKYTLLDRISHGGMAEVYRAKTFGAAGFERVVAIKLLLPNVAMDQDFVTMLIDEAKIAGQLSHANIAQIFDLGMVDGRYYIVQEFVSGLDLRKILRRLARSGRRLSVAQAVHIIIKACEGLEYAHNKRDGSGRPLNLVHRDVSPQNILISSEGEVKLIDFGIAKAEGRATRTLAGLVKGKFAYMSPEQIRGLPVDRRSDVFATGIVLHELLTNKPLFKRKSEFETLKRARSGVIDPPSKLNPDVPTELDAVVLRALARHVEDRYESSVELRDALWQFSRTSGNFYSRNELAAWMADEIAEEEVTNTGKTESSEFPLIEIAPSSQDSNPTVVDLSGQDRDSAELSGEVRSATGKTTALPVEEPGKPTIEISSEVLSLPDELRHRPVDEAEERPTLLFEPGEPGGMSQRLTAEVAPPTLTSDAPRFTAPLGAPTVPDEAVRFGGPVGAPTTPDKPARPTLLAASAPAPLAAPPPSANSPLSHPGLGPVGAAGSGSAPAFDQSLPAGPSFRPMGSPPGQKMPTPATPSGPAPSSSAAGSAFSPPGPRTPSPFGPPPSGPAPGPGSGPSPLGPPDPNVPLRTQPPLAYRPKAYGPASAEKGNNGSKVLLMLAVLVLVGAFVVTAILVAGE